MKKKIDDSGKDYDQRKNEKESAARFEGLFNYPVQCRHLLCLPSVSHFESRVESTNDASRLRAVLSKAERNRASNTQNSLARRALEMGVSYLLR